MMSELPQVSEAIIVQLASSLEVVLATPEHEICSQGDREEEGPGGMYFI
jgi:hypothetical protein